MKLSTAHYAAQRNLFGATRTGRWQARKPNKSNEPKHETYSFANGFPWGKPDE